MSLTRVLASVMMTMGTRACFIGYPGPIFAKEPLIVKKGYVVKKDMSAVLRWTQGPLEFLCFQHSLIEIILILSTYNSFSWMQPMAEYLLFGRSVGECLVLSPITCIAAALVGFGGAVRYCCFREMGSDFTILVTIHDDHRLTTSGPYTVVRHPAYTAVFCVHVGCILWFSARGTWLMESGIYGKVGVCMILVPLIWRTFIAFRMFGRRIPLEDMLMKRQFGSQWDAWAAQVPYRLIPGVY